MPVSKLDNAPRCQHVKMNGDPCAAPARRGADYCVFHAGAHGKPDLNLRMVEDAMSLQYALFQVIRFLAEKEVDTKRAALMLYALQIASSNLKHLREETAGIANRHDIEREKSFLQELLEVLKLPPSEAEQAVEEFDRIAEGKPARDPNQVFDIQACAAGAITKPAHWSAKRMRPAGSGRAAPISCSC